MLPQKERLALRCLELAGYEVYFPRLRERRRRHGRLVWATAPLFPLYVFLVVESQWYSARWAPGVARLIMNGATTPARVPGAVIDEIRQRERGGLVLLPQQGPHLGDRMRILQSPFTGHLALYAGMAPHERVAVLLTLLGAQRRVELPGDAVEAAGPC